MVDGICYCGTQCNDDDCFCDDCFCDECNGVILSCGDNESVKYNYDVPEYEYDIPFVIKKD